MAIGITISSWNSLKTIFQKLFLIWLNSYKIYFSNNTGLQKHMLRNNGSKLWYDWSSIVNMYFFTLQGQKCAKEYEKSLVSIYQCISSEPWG